MRTILGAIVAAGLVVCGLGAVQASTSPKAVTKKKTTAVANKKATPATKKKATAAATKPSTASSTARRRTTATRRTGKKAPVKQASWRSRQLAPTPDRYREIQEALAAKGYLQPADANGVWNQNSIDALKKFQAAQNLDSTGKINSLSLIALGLGPKRDTAAVKSAAEPSQDNR